VCCHWLLYCGEGSFKLPEGQKPDKVKLRKQWCQALGIGQKSILTGEKTNIRIAYWHFPERFRYFDEQFCAWLLRPVVPWIDNERKQWLDAVPISKLDEFVSSYISKRHKPTFRLPAVVLTAQKPRKITFSPSSSGRVSSISKSNAPKSTALLELESAYTEVDAQLAVTSKGLSDSKKENSSLKQELEASNLELEASKWDVEASKLDVKALKLDVESFERERSA
jgi:hypothetical protein